MLIPNKHNGYSRDGRRLYYMDGGNDQPAAEQKASTELPEWAKPYAKDILAKGQALTDVNQNPYQTYNQDRIAGFSPMQQQAMQGAQNMTVAPQTAQGSGLAYGAGLGGLGMATSATPQNFQQNVGGYMNPYLQMALAPQLAEANRQYDISGTRQQSAATQAGAFGGSREAIMAAENERNRNMGLSNIIGQGYNQAFGRAQDQYNQSQQQALQGLGVGIQGAGQLGQLGQNQYGQQMGINQLQSQYGGQQQAQMQRGLDTAYQDFTNQQNYPYKQLGFMSDMIRGLPLGQQSTTQMYQSPPSTMGQLAGLGMGAYGLSRMMAEGGEVKSYAGGGDIPDPMNDPYEMASAVDKLSDEQLQSILRNPSSPAEFRAAQDEMAMRASEQRGVASGITPEMANRMAGGGIVAFADGDLITDPQFGGSTSTYEPPEKLSMSEVQKIVDSARNRGETIGLSQIQDIMDGRGSYAKEQIKAAKENLRLANIQNQPDSGSTLNAVSTSNKITTAPVKDKLNLQKVTKPNITAGGDSTPSKEPSFIDDLRTAQEFLRDPESAARAKKVEASIEALKKQPDEIKKQGLANLLTVAGFGMAQAASQPGAQRGLAGVIQSAAKAGPGVAQAAMDQQKLVRASQDNAAKLDIEYQKYKIAESRGDKQAMISAASNIRTMRQQQAMLDETRRSNIAKEGLEGQRYALLKSQYANKSMTPYINAYSKAEDRAIQAANGYMKSRSGMMDKRSYPEIVEEFAKKYRKNAGASMGFGPTGKTYDTDED